MTLGSGQLARHIGLPWRSAAGTAANLADAQGAGEPHMALWAAMLANATLTLHATGWLEGGLTCGFERFIVDMEALRMCQAMTPPANRTRPRWLGRLWRMWPRAGPSSRPTTRWSAFATPSTRPWWQICPTTAHGRPRAPRTPKSVRRRSGSRSWPTPSHPKGADGRVARIEDDIARITARGGTPVRDWSRPTPLAARLATAYLGCRRFCPSRHHEVKFRWP